MSRYLSFVKGGHLSMSLSEGALMRDFSRHKKSINFI